MVGIEINNGGTISQNTGENNNKVVLTINSNNQGFLEEDFKPNHRHLFHVIKGNMDKFSECEFDGSMFAILDSIGIARTKILDRNGVETLVKAICSKTTETDLQLFEHCFMEKIDLISASRMSNYVTSRCLLESESDVIDDIYDMIRNLGSSKYTHLISRWR